MGGRQMIFRKLLIVCTALLFVICTISSGIYAAEPPGQENAAATDAVTIKTDPGGSAAAKKVFGAGEKLGTDIDILEDDISRIFGKWIDAEVFSGITYLKILVCFFLLLIVVVTERIIRIFIEKKVKKRFEGKEKYETAVSFWDALISPLSLIILVYGSFYAFSPILVEFKGTGGLNLVYLVASKTADFAGYFAIVWFAYRMVFMLETYLMKKAVRTQSDLDNTLVTLLGKTIRIFVIVLGAAIILRSLTGLNLGPLLASLGIGGVAIAFAAKDSIGNFLGSLTIIFDKPFTIGERIVIDNFDGVVEDVGFRSTRIRTLTGHQVSIPNEKVINTIVENIGRRPHMRWNTNITITYDTPPDKVERAVEIIRKVLENHEGMHENYPPRVNFNGFNDWSLNIEVYAWYHPGDFWNYQSWLEKTCLKIMRGFEAEGIEFAFPTRTLYLANDDNRQLKLKMLQGENETLQ